MLPQFRPHERLASNELPPRTIAWLHPLELLRTAYHAWLSGVATSYLDRREMLAALDRDVPDTDPVFGGAMSPAGVWIDFVADVGDSWEATHAVATLMAQRELEVGGHAQKLPHADLVVFGGDLVYPSPTRDSYRRRTRGPIGSAFPAQEVPPADKPNAPIRPRHLVGIPGNHDWYDGLTSFVREFCQRGWLGGWQLLQTRSYFALKLMPRWWIFGIDIALDTRIDPAQQAYFLEVLNQTNLKKHAPFEKDDNVILCTAKPSWLPSSRYSDDAYKNLEFFVHDLIERHKGHVAMMLSGDLHHYSRYIDEHSHQLITSGSGGSYLMGTHHLPDQVRPYRRKVNEPEERRSFLNAAFVRSGFTYPSRSDSRRLALGALLLAFRRANIPFCVTVGLISLWISRMVERVAATPEWHLDTLAMTSALVIVAGCTWFAAAANQRASLRFTVPWGALHGTAQVAVSVLLTLVLMPHALQTIGGPVPPYIHLPSGFGEIERQLTKIADGVVFVLIAGWIGATLVGIYLTLSDLLLRLHHNEVFAAQSICDYRSFIRIHVDGDRFTIYPIGLRRVPRSWRSRLGGSASDPHYEPTDGELLPHLIEGPIHVEVSKTGWPTPPAPGVPTPVPAPGLAKAAEMIG